MRDLIPFRRRGNGLTPSDLFRDFFGRDLLENFFSENFFTDFNSGMRTDIRETEKEYIVEAELPGFSKDNIEIELMDDRLTISAKHHDILSEEKENYLRRERKYGEVRRSFLVDGIRNEDVKAEYNAGVLRVILPKSKETRKKARKIDIN